MENGIIKICKKKIFKTVRDSLIKNGVDSNRLLIDANVKIDNLNKIEIIRVK